jgi:glycerol kinase
MYVWGLCVIWEAAGSRIGFRMPASQDCHFSMLEEAGRPVTTPERSDALPSASEQPAVLCIDAGSRSARAALFSTTGECLSYSQHRCTHQVDESCVEQDPRAILAAIRLCLESLAWEGEVQAAAIVSQGSSVVCYQRSDGRQLSPVISWQDRRGADSLAQLSVDAEEVHARTGLPLSCHYGATKLRW